MKLNYLKRNRINPFLLALNFIKYLIKGKLILSRQTTIRGLKKMKSINRNSILKIGLKSTGFMMPNEPTLINIQDQGALYYGDKVRIGQGCRINLFDTGSLILGDSVHINVNTKIISDSLIEIGSGTSISWDCEISSVHVHVYDGSKEKESIIIGNNVLINQRVIIGAGTVIPDGCAIGFGSNVKGKFKETNCLIAGNPAKIIKRYSEIPWKR